MARSIHITEELKMPDITITMKKESWENIVLSVRKTRIDSVGNFWTAVNIIEDKIEDTVDLEVESHG